MNIDISAKDFALTPANRLYVEEKMNRLGHFNEQISRIRVELDVDHNATKGKINRVEVWVYLPGHQISAGVKAEHMNEAIDLVYPKLEKQLVKIKEKKLSKIKRQR